MITKPDEPEIAAEPLIALQDVTKNYGSFRALDSVSLTITRGVTGILGPNGAGKSTLIKVLLGLVKISHGSGHVLGYPLGQAARHIRSQVGYMPEDDCYVPGLSGVEMVRFAARLSGLPSLEGLRRTHEILDFCGIEQERYRQVETYSTGMRQKLKFAQAIVHDPPLLILDEPTAGLDPRERQIMLGRIRSLSQDCGKTILISTHILPDVRSTCDSVVILAKGRVRVAERLEVLSRPRSPSMHVRLLGHPEAFLDRARAAGASATLNADGTITIEDMDERSSEPIWHWAEQAGVGVRWLRPAQNSLEEIFVAAVREVSGAHT